jgi:GNAT superfamily N-acetyltransferase
VGSDSVLVKAEEGFTTITMNSPERRNALSLGLLRDMTAAFRAAGGSDARGVILAANGPVFSAGHDFRDLAGADAESIRDLLDTCTELMLTMQSIPQPVVARVHGFLRDDSYWASGVSEQAFRTSCAESLCFGVYRAREQLAFARVVTDFARFAYLADVFVIPALRGRGLGKALVQEILQHPELAEIERWLLGTRDAHGLYARFGFVSVSEGRFMLRPKG